MIYFRKIFFVFVLSFYSKLKVVEDFEKQKKKDLNCSKWIKVALGRGKNESNLE